MPKTGGTMAASTPTRDSLASVAYGDAQRLMRDVFVARQPICDRRLNVIAYELLFRGAGDAAACIEDAERSTSTLLVDAFAEIGLDPLIGHRPAAFNVSREFLLDVGSVP